VLKDFRVRFVPSFVVITFLWSSLPQIHMHCFSNTPDFTAHLFTHFPNITSDRRYGTHSWSPIPLSPRLSTGVMVSSDAKCSLPPPPLALCSRRQTEEAVEMPYGHYTLNSRLRDERGEEGWDAEGYDTGGSAQV
jgi:hypothetical protein